MNAERNHERNHHDDLSAVQSHGGSIEMLASGPSKRSNLNVSDPICQSGILRFSVSSPRRSS